MDDLALLLDTALRSRLPLFDELGEAPALRLFNGFWEGWPDLAVDWYGHTLLIHTYPHQKSKSQQAAAAALHFYQDALPVPVRCALHKDHASPDLEQRRGTLLYGSDPDQKVQEAGIWYALDLRFGADASLYLDTRLLRSWIRAHLGDAKVLNTFAYTGSLGAAAVAAGASRVIQTDRSPRALALAQQTYRLNGWTAHNQDFFAGDFFPVVAGLKSQGSLFDCVLIDPPYFSQTEKGRVDLNADYLRLINKVRPLVGDGGWLVAVNNAVFVSGADYLEALNDLTSDYLNLEAIIPAPPDFTGFRDDPASPLPADPAPFNYSTKIALLRVRRKDARRA